jgi:transcriptional regulator with XRE-family HTH domain
MLATVEVVSPPNPKTADDTDKRVGSRITLFRKARGMSQTILGQHIGVTFQQVQKYEKGQNRVGAGRLSKIASCLEVPVSSLLDDDASDRTVPDFLGPMTTSGALELLQAYAAIKDAQARKHLLSLAQSMVRLSEGGSKDEEPGT